MHRHQVLVEEADEVDLEPVARVLHEVDHVAGRVVADRPLVAEGHVALAVALHHLHVAGDPEVEAEAADERAAVARIDVETAPRRAPLLREERHAVGKVDFLERKQLPRRVRQPIDVVDERPRPGQLAGPGGVAPGDAEHGGPVAAAGVDVAQHLRERQVGLAHHADVDLRDQPHDVVRHAREHAATDDDQRARRGGARHLDDVLERAVARGDPAEGDHVPPIGLQHLPQHAIGGAPRVGVVDLYLVAVGDRDAREQRHAVRHVSRIVLFPDDGIDEQDLGHPLVILVSGAWRPAGRRHLPARPALPWPGRRGTGCRWCLGAGARGAPRDRPRRRLGS